MEENQDLGTITVQEPAVDNADIMAQLMEEYNDDHQQEPVGDEDTTELEEVVEEETETVDEPAEDNADEPTAETTETTETTEMSSKANQAFKQMREELNAYKTMAQNNEAYANVIKEIAEANNTTPEELIKNYNDKKTASEAEKAGVPVEVYKKLNSLEAEVQTLRNKPIEERFNAQIQGLVDKYKLQDNELREFFVEANANGFDLTKVKDIGKVYEFLNVDKVINKKEQERLEQKEKIKKQAPLSPEQTTVVEVDEDAEIEAMLKKRGAWNG